VQRAEYVTLKCAPDTLEKLAAGLTHFAAAGGAPDWLVSGAWLLTGSAQYFATASVEVLPDGFVARGLDICSAAELAERLAADIPDVSSRLIARGNGMDLPAPQTPEPPQHPSPWPFEAYATHVLVRISQRASSVNRVACALLFRAGDRSLLVGSDVQTLALVLSEDSELIGRYREDCEALTPADYLAGI
jgi:hypothetical protein